MIDEYDSGHEPSFATEMNVESIEVTDDGEIVAKITMEQIW